MSNLKVLLNSELFHGFLGIVGALNLDSLFYTYTSPDMDFQSVNKVTLEKNMITSACP